jgi:hypothetical protein
MPDPAFGNTIPLHRRPAGQEPNDDRKLGVV